MKKSRRYFAITLVSAMIMAVLPDISASADAGDIHTVTYNLTGVTVSPQETEVVEGDSMEMVFTAEPGYTLPDTVSVKMADVELSDYIYEDGSLTINEVYGDVSITANGISESGEPSGTDGSGGTDEAGTSDAYSISYDLYEVTASKQEGTVNAGTKYSVKLTANNGFRLDPLNVAVRVNGEYVSSGYSYNEGLLEIDVVDGDIIIEAIAVPKPSSKKNNTDDTEQTDGNTGGNNSNNSNNNNHNKQPGSSSSSSNSKSSQALANNGGSATDYNTSSYRAPRTGDDGIDIRYYGAFALIFIGAGFILAGKKDQNNL